MEAVHRLVHIRAGLLQRSIKTSRVKLRKSPAVLDMVLSKVPWVLLWRGQ